MNALPDLPCALFTQPPVNVPTDFVVDGPLLGNGDVGAVLSGPPEALAFHVGKNDAWTHDDRRLRGGATLLTVGGLRLDTPALTGVAYHVEQDIRRAELRGRFAGNRGTLEFTAWMPREPNLLVCELRHAGGESIDLAARLWVGDPQPPGIPDRAGQVTFLGHTSCWLSPCIDQFCGEIQAARVYAAALAAAEIKSMLAGRGPAPLHEFSTLGEQDDPLPLAQELPVIAGHGLTLSVRVRPAADGQLRAARKAVQPHGVTFHYNADVQFLLAKPGVFNLRLVDGQPAMSVGRRTAAADCRLTPGEWATITAVYDGHAFHFYINGQVVPTVTPDRVHEGTTPGVLWARRELDPDRADGVAVALATACHGGDSRIDDGRIVIRLERGQSARLVAAVVSQRDAADPLATAQRLAADGAPTRLDALRAAHDDWWRNYWERSAIDVGDPLIHRYYEGAYYLLACCCGDASKTPPGLFGNWITTDTPAWRGDFHLNYNYQAPWWGAFSGNRVELADSYDQPLLDYLPAAREHARGLGHPGVVFPVGIGPWGIISDANFWGQKSNAAYAAINLILRWQVTQDRDYLRQKAYPFASEVAAFWERYLRFEAGRYVIRGDAAGEGTGDDLNAIQSLGLVRALFVFMREASEVLGTDADRRATWRHILEHLSEFPTQERQGKTVFAYTEQGFRWGEACGNSIQLQHVFPAGCLGLDSAPELLVIARETVRQLGTWGDGNAFASLYTQAARVGYDPEIILKELTGQLRSPHALPNLYLSYGGGGIETCGGITGAINEMLMQSHEEVIRLFPCWPAGRDAAFRGLRARGAFLVSARRAGGVVREVSIFAERGGPCKLAWPWDAATVALLEEGGNVREVAVRNGEMEWTCRVGGHYQIRPLEDDVGLEKTSTENSR
jgi:alpha-L-fucosidase 2